MFQLNPQPINQYRKKCNYTLVTSETKFVINDNHILTCDKPLTKYHTPTNLCDIYQRIMYIIDTCGNTINLEVNI